MYDSALSRLISGDFELAAYYMGAMTHYIADMGVFGHTMGAYTDWGSETHHSDYESTIEPMLASLTLPSTITLSDSDAHSAATDLARTITFGAGTIKSNVWMDRNYDWSDSVFTGSAMASLFMSVSAVAAAINHLLTEAAGTSDDSTENQQTATVRQARPPPLMPT